MEERSSVSRRFNIAVIATLIMWSSNASATDPIPAEEGLLDAYPKREDFSPYANRNFPTNVYWGEIQFCLS